MCGNNFWFPNFVANACCNSCCDRSVVAQRVESVTNENSTLPLCIPIVPCNLCGNVGGVNTGCNCGNVGGTNTGCNCGNVGGANTGCGCGNVGGANTGCGCHHRRRWYR